TLMTLCRIFSIAAIAGSMVAALYPIAAHCQSSADPTDPGKAVFKRANCMGCHKWHGNGGGGYGGDALSLRQTELTREQIIETVRCGRPGTGRPFFRPGAHDSIHGYDMNRLDACNQLPPEAGVFLREKDVEEVADYVIAHIKGKEEPTLAEFCSFFSETSRVCDIYKKSEQAPSSSPDTAKAQ